MTLRDFFERYGVALAIVGILAIVIIALPGNANRQQASRHHRHDRHGRRDIDSRRRRW